MARQHKKGGKIILISSTLGYMSFLGYASYAPGKHALRGEKCLAPTTCAPLISLLGLADTLQSELMLYDINVHIHFPNTMYTPGYEEENKTKPAIVKKIESTDEGSTAEQAAQALYKGTFVYLLFTPFCVADTV